MKKLANIFKKNDKGLTELGLILVTVVVAVAVVIIVLLVIGKL